MRNVNVYNYRVYEYITDAYIGDVLPLPYCQQTSPRSTERIYLVRRIASTYNCVQ